MIVSDDQTVGDTDDQPLGDVVRSEPAGPDGDYTVTEPFALPEDLVGDFFVFVQADANDDVSEAAGETNNDSDAAAIEVTPPYADLVVEAVTAPTAAQTRDEIGITYNQQVELQ